MERSNPLDIEMDNFKEGQKSNKDIQKHLSFKVVSDVRKKPRGKTSRPGYTLDCERRLSNLKREFKSNLDS